MNVLISMPKVESLEFINPIKLRLLQVELDKVFTKLQQLHAQTFIIAEQSFARDIYESSNAAVTSLLTKEDREFLPFLPEFSDCVSNIPITSELIDHSMDVKDIGKVGSKIEKTMQKNYEALCSIFEMVIEFTMPRKYCIVKMGEVPKQGLKFVYQILTGDEFFYLNGDTVNKKVFYDWS